MSDYLIYDDVCCSMIVNYFFYYELLFLDLYERNYEGGKDG